MGQDYPAGPRDKFFGMAIGRRLQKQTLEFVTDVSRNYGDLTYFRLGPFRVYTVNAPQLVREVLVTKAKQFPKVERSTRVLSQFDGQGLAVSQGDFWLRQRRLVQPAFHLRRMTRYAEVAVDQTRRRMEQWQSGKVYNMADQMTDLAIEVIAKALFDVEVGAQTEQLRRAVDIFSETLFFEISAPLVLPDWLPLPAKRRKRWAIQTVDTMIRNIIRERRASKDDRGDLLSMLLLAVDEGEGGKGMTDEQARDEAVTMFRSGHDTTAAGLVWIWYMLAKHPEAEARVIQEVDSVLQGLTPTFADLPQLPFTEMVVKETLRLYPPIWALFGREASADVELGGFVVPSKAQILILGTSAQSQAVRERRAIRPRSLCSGEDQESDTRRVHPVWIRPASLHRAKFCDDADGAHRGDGLAEVPLVNRAGAGARRTRGACGRSPEGRVADGGNGTGLRNETH